MNNMTKNDDKKFREYILGFTKTNEILTKESINNVTSSSVDMDIVNKNINEYIELCDRYNIVINKNDLNKNRAEIQMFLLFQIYKVYRGR